MIIEEIKAHFEYEFPREGCGVLYTDGIDIKWKPIKNVAEDHDNFILDPVEYTKILISYSIIAIVHSHVDDNPMPSNYDIAQCEVHDIPYLIFAYPSMRSTTLEPSSKGLKPLVGREYVFGINDCFELARDYYKTVGLRVPARELWRNEWWEKGDDYFSEENIATWGFHPGSIRKDSFITFAIGSQKANHCGVYLGEGSFVHHATGRLSVVEPLEGLWRKKLSGVYNYG